MILRVQVNLEIDTASRKTRIVKQQMQEGPSPICLAKGCGKRLTHTQRYCSRECFKRQQALMVARRQLRIEDQTA